jgi:hypothetical protein
MIKKILPYALALGMFALPGCKDNEPFNVNDLPEIVVIENEKDLVKFYKKYSKEPESGDWEEVLKSDYNYCHGYLIRFEIDSKPVVGYETPMGCIEEYVAPQFDGFDRCGSDRDKNFPDKDEAQWTHESFRPLEYNYPVTFHLAVSCYYP